MKSVLKLAAMAVVLSLCVSQGFAVIVSPLCVTNASSGGWVETGSDGGSLGCPVSLADPQLPVTFVIPENPTTPAEAVGDFVLSKAFNMPFGHTAVYFTMTDKSGDLTTISDYILFGNTGNGNTTGEVLFYSDPLGGFTPPSMYDNGGNICLDSAAAGCVATSSPIQMVGDGAIIITIASDGETFFDPFGAGFDTSDGIQFQSAAPEPSSLFMSLLLLAVGLGVRRWVHA